MRLREPTLDERYDAADGRVLLTGIQALVRIAVEQRRLDARRGLNTAAFVSGYPGSPLGGVDRELERQHDRLREANVVFLPGVNEELAATAVAGTQLIGGLEHRRVDGVTGYWFGKSPGLDRAADAIRHGNLSGTAPLGGAVAWIGDDPASKSSTVPSSSEPLCRSLHVPLLAPGTVQEQLALGLHAVALSRHAGLWSGLKVVADVADATAVVELDGLLDQLPQLPPRTGAGPPMLLPPVNLDAEHDLMTARLAHAAEYARHARLNRVVFEPRRPRIAIVAAGMAFQAVLRALDDLGLGDDEARGWLGLRLVQLAMPWPLDRDDLRALTEGVETVLVVEDKLPFVEQLVRDALYRRRNAPLVLGKEDADGAPLLSPRSTLGADEVALALGRVLGWDSRGEGEAEAPIARELPPHQARARLELLGQRTSPSAPDALAPLPKRTPAFCSGCPHNISTRAQPDQLVGTGIGCHIMVALDTGDRRGKLLGMPQMGGEGAQWLGLAPFTDDEHFVQNLGDGTFFHSGSLALRAAVAAHANVTYKLLYNDAVAMTGGQAPPGRMAIPELTRWLALEGVGRIVITTPEPKRYRGIALDPIASVRHRDELPDAEQELARAGGVTVLIHDDRCATEKRRLRKRGTLPTPVERVWINERVCEGCGDCGEQSSCLSVVPVETELGRKTRIDQSSCNQDFSCLKGDCPSFLTVIPSKRQAAATRTPPSLPADLPAPPAARVGRDVLVRMPGVGGTGVVTVSQILQMAAHLDGRFAAGLEQTGLAQKGGPVISDIRISDAPVVGQLRAGAASADVLLGFDLLGAAGPETLAVCDPARTVAVIDTAETPTARMITDTTVRFPLRRDPLSRIARVTRPEEALSLDAGALSEQLFGDRLPANLLLVGAAFQHGCIPLSAEAIEQAIRLNGVAVARNLAAFAWGRAAVADPDGVGRAVAPSASLTVVRHAAGGALAMNGATGANGARSGAAARDGASARVTGASVGADGAVSDPIVTAIVSELHVEGELRRLLELRLADLIAYQDEAYARRYARAVEDVAAVERERGGVGAGDGSMPIAEAFARGLHKLMAYKDEYEVARLHLDATERARREQALGADAKVRVMLHPPVLRALGLRRKLALGRSATPLLRTLAASKRLRGTRLDPFGHTELRRLERALVDEYEALVQHALTRLDATTAPLVAEIAGLPELVRGYEAIKLRNVERFRARAQELLTRLEREPEAGERRQEQPAVPAL
ncbi:MAG TPA: indolepyruvate ferredoxin oxidoreductase family protein [Conexibacter sp.]|jgi:indolepyruvate ferredoxin oxidoreductase